MFARSAVRGGQAEDKRFMATSQETLLTTLTTDALRALEAAGITSYVEAVLDDDDAFRRAEQLGEMLIVCVAKAEGFEGVVGFRLEQATAWSTWCGEVPVECVWGGG